MLHSALVNWVARDKMGRKHLPPVLRMMVLSRFPEDGKNWPDGSWSVEILFDQPPAEQANAVSEAKVQFVFDGAPEQRLHAGARFSIYHGPTKIADVHVLD